MTATKMPTNRQVLDGLIRLEFRNRAAELPDREIRIAVKAMRDELLLRQQERASKKYLAKT